MTARIEYDWPLTPDQAPPHGAPWYPTLTEFTLFFMALATGFKESAGSAVYARFDRAARHYIRTGALPDDLDSLLSFLACEQRRYRWSDRGEKYSDPNRRFVDALLGAIRAHLASHGPANHRE
jgi:hypothetical protein